MLAITSHQLEKLERSMYEQLWREAHISQISEPPIEELEATLAWLNKRGVSEKSNITFVFRMCALSNHEFIRASDINAMFEQSIGGEIRLSGDEVLLSLQRYAVHRKD